MSLLGQFILGGAGDEGVLGASLPSWAARDGFPPPTAPVATDFELPFLFPLNSGGDGPAELPDFDLPGILGLFGPQAPSEPAPVFDLFDIFSWFS